MRSVTGLIVLLAGLAMGSTASGVQIVGHRGASADAPENTLASFKLGYARGADAVEGDYWLTADHKVICIHDGNTARTTGVKEKVAAMTQAQLRELDAGSWKGPQFAGQKLPLLEEVLAIVPAGKKVLLELKSGPEIVSEVARIVKASGLAPAQVVVISFNEKAIAAAKKALPGSKCLLLYDFKKKEGKWSATRDQIVAKVLKLKVDGLDVGYREGSDEIVDAQLAKKLSDHGLELHAWTVDSPELARKLIDIGVSSITTNRPGKLRVELGL